MSATEIEPVSAPAAVGLKVTEIVQVAAGATEALQVLVWLKSPVVVVILLIVRGAVPVLVTVTTCAEHSLQGAFTT